MHSFAPSRPARRVALLLLLAAPALPRLLAQSQPEEYRVYTEHPRLFLRPQRLRLLKRERERQSMRWRQFETLVAAQAQMPEPGFALALYYQVSGNPASGKKAIDWALGPAADLRQLALVFDWCQDLLTESQAKSLAAKIGKLLAGPAPTAMAPQRDRILAAIATAELNQDAAETRLRQAVQTWWNGALAAQLNHGLNVDPGADLYAMLEILHAVRDNLTIDLRSSAPDYFKNLPAYQVLCNYPTPLPATENEYRVPIFNGDGEPDLTRSAFARAAGLATVAFDTNALENQFLQGWLIQDRFMLRGALGAPYEFLWANPYQPGLSYAHLPLILHDNRSGSLFIRSNWDEDATWFALNNGQAQLFRDGRITVLSQQTRPGVNAEPIRIGEASVVAGGNRVRFKADGIQMFILGWKPRTKYDVEIDDEEMMEVESDAAGTLVLPFAGGRTPGVRIHPAGVRP